MESLSATLIVWYLIVLVLGWQISRRAILVSRASFIAAGLKGNDMGREDRPEVMCKMLENYLILCLGCRIAWSYFCSCIFIACCFDLSLVGIKY